MTYETHVIGRRGHMNPQVKNEDGTFTDGEYVTDEAIALAVELETGVTAEASGKTDEEAIESAEQALAQRIIEKREAAEEAKARRSAEEESMARLERLETIVREAGLTDA